ncbi:hypothetical protein GCM10011410_31160 [Hoyosella rhizosphaerae]|uniref:Integral membrane bound transporter domain-containing protein n=2 Tax=Hoyosella rhizosphaerae TaxID=1755582 RepID=A0A916XID0_9ACTN|nr:hypothetical protein GCM10011410_31160 [Hoyosella rhizosphaerae]
MLGHPREAVLCSIGALAVLYGENRAYRIRWRVVLAVGSANVASFSLTMLVSHISSVSYFAIIPLIAVIAATTTYVMNSLRWGAPGPVFVVLAASVGALSPYSGLSVPVATMWVAVGVAGALIATMTPILVDPLGPARRAVEAAEKAVDAFASNIGASPTERHRTAKHTAGAAIHHGWATLRDAGLVSIDSPSTLAHSLRAAHIRFLTLVARDPTNDAAPEIEVLPPATFPLGRPTVRFRLRRAFHYRAQPMVAALRVLISTSAAGAIGASIGLEHPEWAMVAAVLVLGGAPDRIAGSYRGIQRFIGTAVGIVLFIAVYAWEPHGLVLVCVLGLLLFGIELTVPRNYAVAASFITPLALLLSTSMQPGHDALTVSAYRLVETAIGVSVALIALWTMSWREDHRMQRHAELQCLSSIAAVVDAYSSDAQTLLSLRRDAQFDLIGAALAADAAARSVPSWARTQWPTHVRLIVLGYKVLARVVSATPSEVADMRQEIGDVRSALLST